MDTKIVAQELHEIGLNPSEIKVYLALLELGSSTTGPIIDKSQTANSKIYAVLEKLISRGLVTSFMRKNVKHYKATHPRQILHYLNEQKKKFEEKEVSVEKIMPLLTQMFSQQEEEKEAVVFTGAKGVRVAFREIVDSLEKGDVVNVMGVHNFGESFQRHAIYFQKIRREKRIKGRFLMNRKAGNIAELFSQYPPVEIRFMQENIVTPSIFLVYKNKVIINLADDLVMFMVTSQRAADSFNSYFEILWKGAEKHASKTK